MSIFTSQFDRVRPVSHAYTGTTGQATWRTPAAVAAAAAGGLALVGAAAVATGAEASGDGWEDAWDAGWDASWAPGFDPSGDELAADWSHHGDYTDAGVGGDEDFFYFIDGDSSLTIG